MTVLVVEIVEAQVLLVSVRPVAVLPMIARFDPCVNSPGGREVLGSL